MNLLNFFKKPVVPDPAPIAAPPAPPRERELYRVGATTDGKTTLTLTSPDGFVMTLTMNQQACEQMIKILRATYTDDVQ